MTSLAALEVRKNTAPSDQKHCSRYSALLLHGCARIRREPASAYRRARLGLDGRTLPTRHIRTAGRHQKYFLKNIEYKSLLLRPI